jgi:hypothetical protein
LGVLIPPINRRAIFGRPCGTGPAATRQMLATLPVPGAATRLTKVSSFHPPLLLIDLLGRSNVLAVRDFTHCADASEKPMSPFGDRVAGIRCEEIPSLNLAG